MMSATTMTDAEFLRAIGVTLSDAGAHGLCHQRWIEERTARETAERMARDNWRAYQAASESDGVTIAYLRHGTRRLCIAAAVGWGLASASVVAWLVFILRVR